MSHVYGPVPSRRLGRSLGVDLVPFKTCSYDCIYCQLGRCAEKTTTCREWTPLDEIVSDLKAKLTSRPDYITLSGSGEPTLFSRLGELIDRIKSLSDVPVALLTNGSLLWRDDVRSQVQNADLIIPSLDAADETLFRAVNRPHEDISFEKMLGGLIALRKEFKGNYWLEIFLLAGYTALEAEVVKLVTCADRIKPDRVQLNTVIRPPAEDFACAVSRKQMTEFAKMFHQPAEVIADFPRRHERIDFSVGREEILNMLSRRPCSVEDIATGLGMHPNEILKHLEGLADRNLIVHSMVDGKVYYKTDPARTL
jgi:wyosine [tRNA(Phe)-imidazoG37] synthetase (radical SAM superfamily)